MALPTRKPWDRMDGESAREYRRFAVYRDLGPARSLIDTQQACTGKRPPKEANGLYKQLASFWHWASRAEAFDREVDRIANEQAKRDAARAAIEESRKWSARKNARRERIWLVSENLLIQANRHATATGDDPGPMRAAAAVLEKVHQIGEQVLDRAVADTAVTANDGATSASESIEDIREQAARELNEWVREQAEKLSSFTSAPPTPPTSSTPMG